MIGIDTVKIKATGIEGLGFAIPINTVRQVVNQLVDKGSVSWPYLGVSLVANGPSANAGIKKDDIILSINGKTVESSSEIKNLVRTYSVGVKVTVVVTRNGAQQTFTVTLGQAPAPN
ncbi:MAG TPA: PDZ domain-containing protein [Bacillota bacterium]